MGDKQILTIKFAEIVVRFYFPEKIGIPTELVPYIYEDTKSPDVEYEICLLERPLDLSENAVASVAGMEIYQYKKGWIRVFKALKEKNGCQVACFIRENGRHILYYPASKWKFYAEEFHFLHLIAIEEILIRKDAFLLHSSLVMLNGQAVLFSGPSGIGKSTQAELWKKCLGAEILNGDRCVIRKMDDKFYGCGSPWCGTSGIYRKEYAPIKGIFVLKQASENTVRRLKIEAFLNMYQQSIINTWNKKFLAKISDLIANLADQIPVYELSCRPDEDAVMMAYQTVFGEEIEYG